MPTTRSSLGPSNVRRNAAALPNIISVDFYDIGDLFRVVPHHRTACRAPRRRWPRDSLALLDPRRPLPAGRVPQLVRQGDVAFHVGVIFPLHRLAVHVEDHFD